MNRLIICFLGLFFFVSIAIAQTPPKRELRGAWFSTFLNLDWPSTATRTVQEVKDSVIKLLELQQQAGINVIYFQVRNECDAVYASSIEPWSASVTGTQGVAPEASFDPLQFMIEECRKRGMEIHAWFNPYRAVNNYNLIGNYASTHVANQHPEWLLAQGTLRILNPGIPAVRDYVLSVVMDVLRRYDIDGVHYDDYFYPYPGAGGTSSRFNDNASFASYPRGFSNQNDWRRDNIDLFIQRSYDSVKAIKPWVKFGVSPFGIWRNQGSDSAGSATNGLQSYSDVYADSRKWLQQGWVDYVTPQLYWSIGFNTANYGVLIPWWNSNANGRHIYSGQAPYKINADSDPNWNNPSQINQQVRLNRTYNNIHGSTYFRARYFAINPLQFRDSLEEHLYTAPALLPTMPWRDPVAPQPVSNVTAQVNGNNVQLSWTKPPTTSNELDKARQFVVYRFNSANVDLNQVHALQTITPNDQITTFADNNLTPAVYYYVVTSLDRFHNESVASNVKEVSLIPTTIVVPPTPLPPAAAEIDVQLQANPNPFVDFTLISYVLPKPMQVSLIITDNNGNQVLQLVDAIQPRGKQIVRLPGTKLSSGIYYATLRSKEFTKSVKIVVTK